MSLGNFRGHAEHRGSHRIPAGRRALARAAMVAAVALPPAAARAEYSAGNTFDLTPAGYKHALLFGIGGTQQVGHATGADISWSYHAMLWNNGVITDLNPVDFTSSYGVSSSATQQAGYGVGANTGGNMHALLWSGSASSVVDLNPDAFYASRALGAAGNQQVGYGTTFSAHANNHAVLWTGSAASAVDLNPSDVWTSLAVGTDGASQVGVGRGTSTGNNDHALLWRGSAASFVDLHPDAYTFSSAKGVAGSQQVGYAGGANTGGYQHAMLWSGSAASATDLNPENFSYSSAVATNGAQQVGEGYGTITGGQTHALLWNGTSSAVDLQALLPGTFVSSTATAIDAYGNVAGYADLSGYVHHAVVWYAGDVWSANSGDWSVTANWMNGLPGSGGDVLIVPHDASDRTITFNEAATVGKLTIDSQGSGMPTLSITGGSLGASQMIVGLLGRAHLSAAAGANAMLRTGSVSVNSQSQLDLADNRMILTNQTASAVSALVKSGRNGGTWDGSGIVTSMADALRGYTTLAVATASDVGYGGTRTFGGESVAPSDVLVMYTVAGDANLSGAIDGDDFFRIDAGATQGLSGYANGDFDFNGKINADDYFLLDQNYARQGAATPPAVSATSPVPEPVGTTLGVGMALLAAARRRRI